MFDFCIVLLGKSFFFLFFGTLHEDFILGFDRFVDGFDRLGNRNCNAYECLWLIIIEAIHLVEVSLIRRTKCESLILI